jgi:hypothetical protein
MDNILAKMTDSKMRRDEFMTESHKNVELLRDFISQSEKRVSNALALSEDFRKSVISVMEEQKTAEHDLSEFNDILPLLADNLVEAEGVDAYNLMMLVSLIREYTANGAELKNIELF